MSLLNNRIGISISSDRIQLIELVRSGNNYIVESIEEEFFEEEITEDTKEAKYINILQNSFNEILLRKPLLGNSVSVTLPPSIFRVFDFPSDKNLTKNDLKDYIKWELAKLFPSKKKDYFIFQKIILNPLNFELFRRVLVFALPTHILKILYKFCSRNNLALQYVDNSHSAVPALLKGKRLNYPILSMYIENNFASYFLLSDNGIITQFSKSFEKVSDLPEISMRIIEEIKNSENNAESIENIFIFGNNVSDELKSSLIEFLGIKVISFNPFTLLKIDEDLNENRFIHEFGYRFSPAVGIALRS